MASSLLLWPVKILIPNTNRWLLLLAGKPSLSLLVIILLTFGLRGHDSDDSDDELPDKLQKVDLPIVPRGRCRAAYDHRPVTSPDITDDMVCAGYMSDDEYENDESPCGGDSGGPLVDKSTGVVVGITSWGPSGCGTDGAPNVFARVGSLRSFIDKHMDSSKRL